MLPRLEAEHELMTINAMSVAFGGGRPDERRRYIAKLQRAARGSTRATKKAGPEQLAAMGIAVTVVPPKSGKDASAPRSGQEADRLGDEPSAPRSGQEADRSGDPNG